MPKSFRIYINKEQNQCSPLPENEIRHDGRSFLSGSWGKMRGKDPQK